MIPAEPLPPRYVCIWYDALGDDDTLWKTFVDMLVYTLHERRGMPGQLVYRPDISGYPANVARVYQLTHNADHEIVLESAVVSPYVRVSVDCGSTGTVMKILAWDPTAPLHPKSSVWTIPLDQLSRISGWRHAVAKATTRPPTYTEIFLDAIKQNPGSSPDAPDVIINETSLALALDGSSDVPSRFPLNFIPTSLAMCTPQGWISCLQAVTPRRVKYGNNTKIVWDVESIPGRNSAWMPCPRPTPDELTLLPPYITGDSPPRVYLKGWSFRVQVYRELVEVYPEDVIDADPI